MDNGNRVRYTRQNILLNSFFQLPKFLFDDEFSELTNDARVLYAILRNRHEISIKNGWVNENDEVYLYFKREEMQAVLGVSAKPVIKAMHDLKVYGLLEEIQQGLGKPNMIFLLTTAENLRGIGEIADEVSPETLENTQTWRNDMSGHGETTSQDMAKRQVKTWRNDRSRHGETTGQDMAKRHTNHNNIIYNNMNHKDISPSSQSDHKPDGQNDMTENVIQKSEDYAELIKNNIAYNDLAAAMPYSMDLINEFIEIMVDVIMTEGETVRIDGEPKPRAIVVSQLMKLTYDDIVLAVDQFKNVTERIVKKKPYILTLLYNCKLELHSHYTNAVISDKWQ